MKLKELLEKYGNAEITEEKEKELKALLKIKESKNWRPKDGEERVLFCHKWDGCLSDENRYFKTEEEADFRLEQIKVYNELKKIANECNDEIDWYDEDSEKYSITYNYYTNTLDVQLHSTVRDMGQIYFSSDKLALQAIEEIGEERIKKYLFGIKNERWHY